MVRTSLLYTYVTLFLLQQPQQGRDRRRGQGGRGRKNAKFYLFMGRVLAVIEWSN